MDVKGILLNPLLHILFLCLLKFHKFASIKFAKCYFLCYVKYWMRIYIILSFALSLIKFLKYQFNKCQFFEYHFVHSLYHFHFLSATKIIRKMIRQSLFCLFTKSAPWKARLSIYLVNISHILYNQM